MPPIIDSHIHLFTEDHLPHLAWATPENSLYAQNSIPEYLSGIPPSGLADFKGFVFIETDRRYTIPSNEAISKSDTVALKKAWQWPLEEFEFVYGLSKTHAHGKYVLGIVPWAPMNLGVLAVERFYELLDVGGEENAEKKGMLKGFRYLVQDKPSGTIGEVKFRESMGWVWKKGLVVEIGVDTRSGGLWQLEEAVKAIQEVVKDSEDVEGVGAFVVNHLCKPNLQIDPSEISSHPTFRTWKSNVKALAASHPSIVMKISGIFAELPHDESFSKLSASQKEGAIIAHVTPWISEVLSIFGPDRVIWGSDWPVCKMGFEKIYPSGELSAWETWRVLAAKVMQKLGQDEDAMEKLFSRNTVRVYKLR
ncbi:unnamed protein product [Tuber melanosporum]|uniref:(Perigord truffle) hypothetical protein n=1 Tax=Tuber melanosporum (strain Mel28) TaxID=656061 RepID=D5G904_TUBMM|nr:uncharacterized protein GSTUM_00004923001 [Tuber melanosporum]CAZ80997.1 unnamed protein product [Tuber melanosporum]